MITYVVTFFDSLDNYIWQQEVSTNNEWWITAVRAAWGAYQAMHPDGAEYPAKTIVRRAR